MLRHRIIPSLLIQEEGLVKTTKFRKPKYVGDPINAIRIFNEKEVDELLVVDILASKQNREPNFALIEKFAEECFMPVTYGGGIKSVEQAKTILSLGVEKICIQSASFNQSHLISELASNFGSQAVLISVDVKRNWLNRYVLYDAHLEKTLKVPDWMTHIKKQIKLGAGEVLLNSVDKDGTLSGPDLNLIEAASNEIDVPLISLGGVGSLEDIRNAINAGASAVAAGSFFVFHGPHRAVLISYPGPADLEAIF